MKFKEQQNWISGEVLGNPVRAKSPSVADLLAIQRANTDVERTEIMCKMVASCVTMEDGSKIDARELSVNALTALGEFLLGVATGKGASTADFTPAQ